MDREFKALHKEIEELEKEVKDLRKENEYLRKDKARLDFIADTGQWYANLSLPNEIVMRNLSSLRDAVDEAMELFEKTKG